MTAPKPPLALAREARELAAGASAAPWRAVCLSDNTDATYVEGPDFVADHDDFGRDLSGDIGEIDQRQIHADARFIARSRTLVGELAEAVEGLAGAFEGAKSACAPLVPPNEHARGCALQLHPVEATHCDCYMPVSTALTFKVERLAAILRDLATRDPYGESRAGTTYCCHCGGSSPSGGREGFEHEERCVWVRARAVCGPANDG